MQSKYDSIFKSIKSDIYSLKQKEIPRKTPPLVQLDTRILEELVAKILFKMEKYDVAVQLIVNKDLADINITKPERDLLEKLIGD